MSAGRASVEVRVGGGPVQETRDRPGWLLVGAVCAVLVTALPSLVGRWLDISIFQDWGVLAAYLGISWLLPGGLVGLAVFSLAGRRNVRHRLALAVTVGVAVGFALLLLSVALWSSPS